MPIWITWLLARPAWILCIALGAFAGIQTARTHSLQSDVREAKGETALVKAAIATERLTFEQQAREQERRQSEALAGVAAVYEQEKKDAEREAQRVVAELRAGTQRLRREWAGCETSALVPRATDSSALPDAGAELRATGAGRLIGGADQCDLTIRGLQSAIRVMQGAGQ